MTPPRPATPHTRLDVRAATNVSMRTAAGSAATLLRLAEAATLTTAAGVRSLLDLTRLSPRSADPQAGTAAPGHDHPEIAVAAEAVDVVEVAEVATEAESAEESSPTGHTDDTDTRDTDAGAGDTDGADDPLVPHWDELNLARIRGRLPRLGLDELRSLLAYEQEHPQRPQVVAMLENRIRKIEGQDAENTDGSLIEGPDDQEPTEAG